jgi:hypothetical protein
VANSANVQTDISAGFLAAGTMRLQATVSIQLLHPPGCFPTRPGFTGSNPAAPDNGTLVVPAGGQFTTWGVEGNSLIAAGAATLVAMV